MRRDGQGRRRSGVNTDAEPSHLSLRLVGADCWETNVVRTGARNGPGGRRPAPARADAPDKVVAADLITEADIPSSTVASWVNCLDSGQRLDGLALRPPLQPLSGGHPQPLRLQRGGTPQAAADDRDEAIGVAFLGTLGSALLPAPGCPPRSTGTGSSGWRSSVRRRSHGHRVRAVPGRSKRRSSCSRLRAYSSGAVNVPVLPVRWPSGGCARGWPHGRCDRRCGARRAGQGSWCPSALLPRGSWRPWPTRRSGR